MKKGFLICLTLMGCLLKTAAQTLYVNSADSYHPISLSEVGDMTLSEGALHIGPLAWALETVDSMTFTAPKPAWTFSPESSIENVASNRITSRVPIVQDAQDNARQGVPSIGRWTEQTDGSYHFVYHPIAHGVTIDFAALKSEHTIDRIAITSMGNEAIAYPFTYNAIQAVDWLNSPQATGTLAYKSGSTTYLTTLKSDVVVINNIPTNTETVQAYIAPVKLAKGLLVTVMTKDGRYLTQAFPELTFDKANEATRLAVKLTQKGCQEHGCWMAMVPGVTKLNMLTIPGTHDAATSNTMTGTTRTQTLTIAEQLEAGVRAFDFRPRFKANKESDIELDNLEIYHGIAATGVKWKDAMDALIKFVTEHPTEMVIVNMQKESSSGTDYSSTWRKSVRTYLTANKSKLVTQMKAALTLADCRGKVLVMSRTPYGNEGVYNDVVYGALIDWKDNTAFDTNLKYTNNSVVCTARIEDQYDISDKDKKTAISDIFAKASSDTSTKWYMTFTNIAWKLFGGGIDTHAKVINPATIDLLKSGNHKRLGVVFTDYIGSNDCSGKELLKLLIEQNFKYIY